MVGFFHLDMIIFANVLRINTIGTVIPSRVFEGKDGGCPRRAIINCIYEQRHPLTRVPAMPCPRQQRQLTQWLQLTLHPPVSV